MGFSRKQSASNFPENEHLPPDSHKYVCVSADKKCLFFGNFDMLCLLETAVLRFALMELTKNTCGFNQSPWMLSDPFIFVE